MTDRTLEARIADRYPTLTPQERRAADALLAHLGDLGTYRATELAALAEVSKATISRLVRRLDYDDFESMRDELRRLRQGGMPVATDPTPGLSALVSQDVANLHRLHANLDESVLDGIADRTATARRLVVCGQRSSYGVASVLRMNLAQIRPGTWLVPQPGQSLAEDIADLGPADLAIVLSFRRHSPRTVDLLEALRSAGVPTALIADEQLRRLAARVMWWIECPATSPGAFDSHAAAMTLVALLSDRVLALVPDAPERIERVDDHYRMLHDISER